MNVSRHKEHCVLELMQSESQNDIKNPTARIIRNYPGNILKRKVITGKHHTRSDIYYNQAMMAVELPEVMADKLQINGIQAVMANKSHPSSDGR